MISLNGKRSTYTSYQEAGDDGGEKVNGRKQAILVNTMGLLLCGTVHSDRR